MQGAWIVETLENAYRPLSVFAEEWDYGARVRYSVRLPPPHDAIKRDDLVIFDLTYDGLRMLIESDRRRIQEAGISLLPWTMPARPTQS